MTDPAKTPASGGVRTVRIAEGETASDEELLGTAVLLYLVYTIAVQVIAGVFGILGFIVYLAILLATSFEGLVLGMILLTIISMAGSYAATFLLAPFLSAGFVAVYADSRMRHEAWDVELLRQAREAWDGESAR